MDSTFLCCLGAPAAVFLGVYEALGTKRTPMPSHEGVSHDPLGEWLQSLPAMQRARQRSERERRRRDSLRQLPTMIDVVTLGLTAGLSFDASLELYCQHYHTSLSHALSEAMLTWRMGTITRSTALSKLADELGVSAMRRFADAVSQALAFGAPLSAALERQSQVIRDEQRAEMEAEIERLPVKMLIPLGTLIVPAMLLAILGPLLGPSVVMVG